MTRLRARIAQRLLEAQASQALLTTFNEVDLTATQELRARYKERFEKVHGVKLGFMSFFVKAAIEALKKYPVLNASVDGNDIVYHEYYDIGVAVSTDRGLIVPIVRDADTKSFAALEKEIADYARAAREGSLAIEDLTGGTFTITNGGVFGSLMSTPDRERTAERHSRHAQDPGSPHGGERAGGGTSDDVSGRDLRSSHHRRPRSRAVPGQHQGSPRGPGADAARPLGPPAARVGRGRTGHA